MDATTDLAERVASGSVLHTARLITLIENRDPVAPRVMRELARRCGRAQLLGVTGPPGAGKSTTVAALTRELRSTGRTVGVIAVDPSSPFGGGALLGDRDRMLESASGDSGVFVRSLASRGAAGGLTPAVNHAVDALDAMGRDVIIIETVAVGQAELDIADVAQTVMLVLVPGYGDALQAMKAGITEIADVIAVNKCDVDGADATAKEFVSQGFVRHNPSGTLTWPVPVMQISALRNEGIAELVATLDQHHRFLDSSGWATSKRRARRRAHFISLVSDRLREELAGSFASADEDAYPADPHGAAEAFITSIRSSVHSPLASTARPEECIP